ncbi:polysaccharide biosynthesis C-terminal domain-containing protein [Aurantibacillus circumpalustris]|uniref:polysaccharide biosynthesis C-terminal domain-containing protein n=1 Tax=Aurantibacillus circumpalustris TaxID=3036359 RepID=UPI00295A90A2|nr:polysaccharide biosynthesis C-terminal domain-containing protein [Aurantibacillus circumpalustris]
MGEIKKQSINNTILSYVGAGIGFLIIYIQPHLISSADIGLLRLLYSFSWMAAIIMPFGFGSVTMKFFPKIKNESKTHNGLFALLLLVASLGASVIASLLYLNKYFFVDYYKKSAEFPVYFNEALIFAFILSLISLYSVYSVSLFKTTITVFLTDIFTRLGQLFLIIIYHYEIIDKHTLVLSYIGVFLVQLILLLFYLVRSKAVSFRINWKFYKTLPLKEIIFFALLMMLTAFASLGIKFIDQLMIGHFLNENLVGVYATCVMICAIMEIPFNSLDRIAQPKIASAWSINDVKEVAKIYEMSSRYMFFVGGFLFCILWSSIDLIFLFLPAEYLQGKTAFFIISFSSLFNLLTGVNSSVILYSHKYFVASLFLFALILVAFIANNTLISLYGISGAAMSTLIAIATFNLLKYIYILIRFKMQPFSKHTGFILASILVISLVLFLMPNSLHPFITAAIGCSFTGIVFSVMNIKYNTIEEVNKVFRKFKLIK